MLEYKLQFNEEDVLRVLEDWKEKASKDENERKWIRMVINHNLKSSLPGFISISFLTYGRNIVKNVFQRAYAHNIHNLGIKYIDICSDIIDEVTSASKYKKPKELKKLATGLCDTLENIIQYLPVTETIEQIGPLNDKQRGFCDRADVNTDMAIYTANRLFSPDFQRDEYYLKQDIEEFWENVKEILNKEEIRIGQDAPIERILTIADYLTNAIEPLVWNAREHAFNPENDITGRMKEKFRKEIGVYGGPKEMVYDEAKKDKRPADSGDYIVMVQDNGFGIPEKILPNLFKKGVSTKKDKKIEHGIGLWGVKQFVEKYGGTISLETELGKRTIFEFTIPYSHLKSSVCIQSLPK